MKRLAAAFTALGVLLFGCRVQEASADGLSISIERVTLQNTSATALFQVTNGTPDHLSRVFVDCVFRGADAKPIDMQTGLVANIPPGQTGFGKATILYSGAKTAECRITSAK